MTAVLCNRLASDMGISPTSVTRAQPSSACTSWQSRIGLLSVSVIAAAIALLHLATNSRYGFHRDELQFLTDARHLAWGFVPYPPMTPLMERILLSVFGISLAGLRLFSVLAQSAIVVLTGLMARDLGGRTMAQAAAALSIALSAIFLFEGTEFQYTSFDQLWWVLAAWCVVRLLTSANPRWWLAIGAALGLGMTTKYNIAFFITGILVAMAFTRERRYFLSKWFWAGVALALLLCLPNLLWQIRHDFISYQFLKSIHHRDVLIGRANGFLKEQFLTCLNPVASILWLAGLVSALRTPRFRMLAWMFLIPLVLFILKEGRSYYLAAAYPMLVALGAVAAERWLDSRRPVLRIGIAGAYLNTVFIIGIGICSFLIPFATSGPLYAFALANNTNLREELGWDTMLQTLARVRNSLPPDRQASAAILAGNYGEHGAIEILGPAYHLPPALSGTNTPWLRGYPQPPPSTLIAVGLAPDFLNRELNSCQLAARIPYPTSQNNEESTQFSDIYVCGPPKQSWPAFWKNLQAFR
jgi:hypothetical protein